MKYILRRYVDRHAPGADVTGLYPIEDLAKWVQDGLARVVEEPADTAPTEETPVPLDDLAVNPVEPAVETVTAPVVNRKRSK